MHYCEIWQLIVQWKTTMHLFQALKIRLESMEMPDINNPADALQESILHKALTEAMKSYAHGLTKVCVIIDKSTSRYYTGLNWVWESACCIQASNVQHSDHRSTGNENPKNSEKFKSIIMVKQKIFIGFLVLPHFAKNTKFLGKAR